MVKAPRSQKLFLSMLISAITGLTMQASMRYFAETDQILEAGGVTEATVALMTVTFLIGYAALTYEAQHLGE